MHKSATTTKNCATCNYWTGSRKPLMEANGKEKVEIIEETGICENGTSKCQGKIRLYKLKCNSYSKWTELI